MKERELLTTRPVEVELKLLEEERGKRRGREEEEVTWEAKGIVRLGRRNSEGSTRLLLLETCWSMWAKGRVWWLEVMAKDAVLKERKGKQG